MGKMQRYTSGEGIGVMITVLEQKGARKMGLDRMTIR
jgi:hypothetical protein